MGDNDLRAYGVELFDRWTALWNGDLAMAEAVMAPEFVLRYAQAGTEAFDEVRTPKQLAAVVEAWHGTRTGLVFAAEGTAVVDLSPVGGAPAGSVARPYLATFATEDGGKVARSGIDMFRVEGGRIVEVWSVSSGAAGRTFYR
ncbi:nuclear transport factor 2 family protein [Kitasatospora sp. NPDC048365]|uniref:nuclear transport factor 2 family protein n=1 Tax=Kitasatospora sp. NPDC048365 TaxID=3364050 RepID=UPI00371A7A9E